MLSIIASVNFVGMLRLELAVEDQINIVENVKEYAAKECMENEIKFLDYCKKYKFVPKLISVDYDTLTITMEYLGESIWDYGRTSGDPTRRSYLFAIKFKYRNQNIRKQVTSCVFNS